MRLSKKARVETVDAQVEVPKDTITNGGLAGLEENALVWATFDDPDGWGNRDSGLYHIHENDPWEGVDGFDLDALWLIDNTNQLGRLIQVPETSEFRIVPFSS